MVSNSFYHFNHYSVAPGRSEEAEKLLIAWATRMKGAPGFISCAVLKETGEHGGHDYAMVQEWKNHDDDSAFSAKNRQFNAAAGAPSHHHDDEDDGGKKQEVLFEKEYHGHFEVIFRV